MTLPHGVSRAPSRLFLSGPAWSPPDGRALGPADREIQSWLREPGSLTRRLQGLCTGEFRVVVLGQGPSMPFPDESTALGQAALEEEAIVREVLLQCDGRSMVAARSVIPLETLRNDELGIDHLGTRPLGEVLFADPRLQRGKVEVCEVAPRLWRNDTGIEPRVDAPVWGRRSVYTVGAARLLVAEFFLPALFVDSRLRSGTL